MAPWVSMSVLCRAAGKQQHEAGGSGDVGGCHGGSAGGGSAWTAPGVLCWSHQPVNVPRQGTAGNVRAGSLGSAQRL